MMRKKQVMVGILSAALLLNGTAALTPSVFADDDSESVSAVKPPLDSKKLMNDWLNGLVTKTSAIADKDMIDIQDALASGQTLIQASGLSGGALAEKLFSMADQSAAFASASFSASTDDINKLKADLRSRTMEALTTPGFKLLATAPFQFEAILNERLASVTSIVAACSQEDYIDIVDRLKKGETLIQASKVSEAMLLETLMAPINEQVEQAVKNGTIASVDADSYIEKARRAISETIEEQGGFEAKGEASVSDFDLAGLTNKRSATLIEDASMFTADYDTKRAEGCSRVRYRPAEGYRAFRRPTDLRIARLMGDGCGSGLPKRPNLRKN